MRSSFIQSFEKTAFVGAVLGMAGRGAGLLGKGLVRLGGGKVNTALTGLQAVGDYNQNMKKMRDAAMR